MLKQKGLSETGLLMSGKYVETVDLSEPLKSDQSVVLPLMG